MSDCGVSERERGKCVKVFARTTSSTFGGSPSVNRQKLGSITKTNKMLDYDKTIPLTSEQYQTALGQRENECERNRKVDRQRKRRADRQRKRSKVSSFRFVSIRQQELSSFRVRIPRVNNTEHAIFAFAFAAAAAHVLLFFQTKRDQMFRVKSRQTLFQRKPNVVVFCTRQ